MPLTGLYEALHRESERIVNCGVITGSLERLVSCGYETWKSRAPLHRSRPSLVLTFAGEEDQKPANVDRKLPAALAALSVVLSHSFRLNKLPTLKTQFWKQLLSSKVLLRLDPSAALNVDDWIWMAQDESFPVFQVDIDRCGVMTPKHMDAFFTFLTTPAPHVVSAQYAQQYCELAENKLVPIGIMLGLSKVTPKCLQRIRDLLDRVYAASTRQYVIDRFGMNYSVLKAQQLEGVEAFLEKNHQVYRIPNLRLMNVGQSVLSTGKADIDALCRVINTAVKTSLSSTCTTAINDRGYPQTLDIVRTSLGLKHVMALCSALRYGCAFETLGLTEIFKRVDKAEREQCWRWLAFGIFYPRSQTFAAPNRLRCVDLSHNPLEPNDAEAFIKTLLGPAGELVSRDSRSRDRVLPKRGALTICVVKQGAAIYPEAEIGPEVALELDQQTQLEVLCTQDDWVCVVLSGLGFGWVEVDQVIDFEEEDVSNFYPSIELTFTDILRTASAFIGFHTFLDQVGHQLSYLDVSGSQFGSESKICRAILKHCVNIKHLVLADTWLSTANLDEILEALDGDLGGRLLSLNLNDNLFTDVMTKRLSSFLVNTERVPALQELRMMVSYMRPPGYSSVQNALVVNKELRFLELVEPHRALRQARLTVQEVWTRITEDHQAELLPSPLPLRLKLAFLSAIKPREDGRIATHVALDSFIVSSIFKFAADDVRRRIVWTPSRSR